MKRHYDQGNSYKEKHLIRAGLQFEVLVHYYQVGKHDGIQIDVVVDKELKVLQLDPLATQGDFVPHWYGLSIFYLKAHHHSDTLSPTRPHLLIVSLPMSQVYGSHHIQLPGSLRLVTRS